MNSPPQPKTIEKLERAVWPSFAMLAGIQLDLFTALKDGPMTVEQIAQSIAVGLDKLRPLLYALVATGLLTVEEDLFSNTSEANCFLVRGSPYYRARRHEVILNNWKAGLQTGESVRTGSAQAKRDFSAMSKDASDMFFRGTYPNALRRGRELVARYDFSSHQTLLDVGGGSGGLSIAVTEACPHIQATVLDLPTVTSITQRIIDEAGARDRVQVITADVVNDILAVSFDAIVLSSVIQVLSPDQARLALKNVSKVTNPGGAIYVRGAVLDNCRVSPSEIVIYNLLYLNLFDEGQAYTEQEYKGWLLEAGFEGFERTPLPLGFSLVRAQKPT